MDYFDEDDNFIFEEKDGLNFAVAISDELLNPEKLAKLEQLVELKAYLLDYTKQDEQVKPI